VEAGTKLAEDITSLVDQKDFLEGLKSFKLYSPQSWSQSYLASIVSIMICRKLEWKSQKTLQAVAFGALFQDIGLRNIPPEILKVPIEAMSKEQFNTFKTHPEEGMRIASKFSEIPASVLQIIYQHHEHVSKGYPGNLNDSRIYPLAKIVSLASRYSQYLIEKDKIPVDGLKSYLQEHPELIRQEAEMTKALIKSFIREDKIQKEKQ